MCGLHVVKSSRGEVVAIDIPPLGKRVIPWAIVTDSQYAAAPRQTGSSSSPEWGLLPDFGLTELTTKGNANV